MKADGNATTAAHDACQPRRENGPKIDAAASLTRKRKRVRRWALVALVNAAKACKYWGFARSAASDDSRDGGREKPGFGGSGGSVGG